MTYHLEHPKYPRLYRFEPTDGGVVVERWEGCRRVQAKNMSRDDARRLYRYLRDKVGYREFGFSVVKETSS